MIQLELLKSFLIIGVGAYGGGLVTIPMIEHQAVTVHEWITASELSELIAVAQMTPGPIGVNAATYTGYRVAGIAGAAAATLGFVIPSLVLCLTLVYILSKFGGVSWMETLKKSVQPAVAGLIIAAMLTYGRAALTDVWSAVIAVAAFAVFVLSKDKIHPALLIILGGFAGVFIY